MVNTLKNVHTVQQLWSVLMEDCRVRADIQREKLGNRSVLNCLSRMKLLKHFRILTLIILLGSGCSVAVVNHNITQTSKQLKILKVSSHGLSKGRHK